MATKLGVIARGAVLLVLAATSCTHSKDAPAASPAAKAVLVSAEATQRAGSSRMTIAIDLRGGGQSFAMAGDGAFNYATQVGVMNFKMSGDEIPDVLSGYQMLFVKGLLYLKFPAGFAQIAPGLKPWIRIDAAALAKQQGVNLPGINTFANQDPTSTLAFTKGATAVRSLGSEAIRGEATTHYAMTVDLARALRQVDPQQRAGISSLLDRGGVRTLPVQTWIDAGNRVRRLEFTMDVSRLGPSTGATAVPAGSTMTMTMDLFDFGLPVKVTPPSSSQVSDYSALLKLSST